MTMTKPFTLQVEATPGIKIKVGDRVKKGEKVGLSPDLNNSVLSPREGIVEDIAFEGAKHMFVIRLKPCRTDI